MTKYEKELIPPDRKQCQAEKPTGSFMSFGIPKPKRCTDQPVWIAAERIPGPDGLRGSMSLCEDCRHVLEKQKPGYATFRRIKRKRIGGETDGREANCPNPGC